MTIEHDFDVLLHYVAENKVILTPKQSLVPLRHLKSIMEHFQAKEPHATNIGSTVYKKRDELEYPRFYFLDLLGVDGSFLRITKKNTLVKGAYWKTFFSTSKEDRPFMLFCAFRHDFNFANWFMRGGDFGKRLEEKAELIWPRILQWKNEVEIDWKSWAQATVRECGLQWESIDRTHAEDLAIWGLEYCFFMPLEYFGLVETNREGDRFVRLRSFRLNQAGRIYFDRLLRKENKSIVNIPPFSLN